MDRLSEFLDAIGRTGAAQGRFRGLLHILIGRRITLKDDTVVSTGMTWRELAGVLKRHRWDVESVRELGLDPATLPARDRQKFWYAAISQAGVNTPAATQAGDELVAPLEALGYVVGPAPGAARSGNPT
jgi:hypothetical protein